MRLGQVGIERIGAGERLAASASAASSPAMAARQEYPSANCAYANAYVGSIATARLSSSTPAGTLPTTLAEAAPMVLKVATPFK